MKNVIGIDDLSKDDIADIFYKAIRLKSGKRHDLNNNKDALVITVFFEPSTRTISSFQIAVKKLSLKYIDLDVYKSSSIKGETLFDTAANIDAMGADIIIIRHSKVGVSRILSKHIRASIINAGEGSFAHPTQALLDLFTIKEHFNSFSLEGKSIVIVGDIKSSRVANSNIRLLKRFGLDITLVAPPHFMPNISGVKKSFSLTQSIKKADIVMALRTQVERHSTPMYASLKDYASDFCIRKELIGNRDILIMHPGPVNRNIDIEDDLLRDSRCKVLEQVRNGVFVRMAVLEKLLED